MVGFWDHFTCKFLADHMYFHTKNSHSSSTTPKFEITPLLAQPEAYQDAPETPRETPQDESKTSPNSPGLQDASKTPPDAAGPKTLYGDPKAARHD